jgi:hypothetical protein
MLDAAAAPPAASVVPRWSRNILRILVTAGATALILAMLWDEHQGYLAAGGGGGSGIFLNWRGSGSSTGGSGRNGGDQSSSSSRAKDWDDSMLYTPAGMAHDAYTLMPKSGLAAFTVEAQEFLFKHQFPTTCKGKKFLVSHGNDGSAGLGSHLHISGMHLGLAIELGRIFVWAPDVGAAYTDEETCGIEKMNLECFFRSPSNCTFLDTVAEGADTVQASFGLASTTYGIKYTFTPSVFRDMWSAAHVPVGYHELKYWWRAQSVAFLARFSDAAIARMRALRLAKGKVVAWPEDSPFAKGMARKFPFDEGIISTHIRHGDKGIEMKLVGDERYFQAAEEQVVVQGPMPHKRAVFISTEDPKVLETAKAYTDKRYAFLWYDVPRVNSNGLDQINKLSGETMPKGMLTHVWWLQLLMALECDAWVGTRGSNWNRLIDELRCIWVSCNTFFSE